MLDYIVTQMRKTNRGKGYCEVKGSNPVEVLNFSASLRICKVNARIIASLDLIVRVVGN